MGRLTLALTLTLVLASGLPGKAWSQDHDAGLVAFAQGNAARAEVNWLMAAANGEAEAEFALGKLYEEGGPDVGSDPERAATWYRRAMQRGSIAAETNFALMLLEGRGLVRDTRRAIDLWQNAAEAGQPEAQYNMALAYYHGVGVAPRLRRAAEWMELAAENGLPAAQFGLSEFYRLGVGVARDAGQAAAWEERARANGYGQEDDSTAPAETDVPLAAGEAPRDEVAAVEGESGSTWQEPEPEQVEPDSEETERELARTPDIPAVPDPPEADDAGLQTSSAPPPQMNFSNRETALSATISAILEGEESDFPTQAEPEVRQSDNGGEEAVSPEMSESLSANGEASRQVEATAESRDREGAAAEALDPAPEPAPEPPPEPPPEPAAALEPMPEPEAIPEAPHAEPDTQATEVAAPAQENSADASADEDAAESDFAVWLGSMQSEEGAARLWQQARATHPDLLADRSVFYQTVDTDRGAYRRVLAGGFANREDAGAFCERLRSSNDDTFCQPLRKE